jgi:hypothetical protein
MIVQTTKIVLLEETVKGWETAEPAMMAVTMVHQQHDNGKLQLQ